MVQDSRVPINDYFIASDDVDAVRVISGSGGPGALGFETFPAKGIDPAVALGTLESLMTGRAYDEVTAAGRQCHPLTDGDDDAVVVTVTDTLRDALAVAGAERLRRVAVPWAATDELAGTTPATLGEALRQFAALARQALKQGHHLYCWWAL